MIPFTLARPKSVAEALQEAQNANGAAGTEMIRFVAGGTTVISSSWTCATITVLRSA